MKSLGTAFVLVGLLAVLFGFGSLLYPALYPPRVHPKESHDPDGAWQLPAMGQKFVIGIGGGLLVIAIGGYIRKVGVKETREPSSY